MDNRNINPKPLSSWETVESVRIYLCIQTSRLPNENLRGTGDLAFLYVRNLHLEKWYEVWISPDDTHRHSWVVDADAKS